MTKEHYWKKYGGPYNAVLIKTYGLSPFNPEHLAFIGKCHVRHKRRVMRQESKK